MSCVSRMLGHAGHMVGTKLFRHLCQLFTKGSSLDVHPSSRDYLYARVQEICKSAPAGTDSERDPESRLPCQVSTRTFGSEVHPIWEDSDGFCNSVFQIFPNSSWDRQIGRKNWSPEILEPLMSLALSTVLFWSRIWKKSCARKTWCARMYHFIRWSSCGMDVYCTSDRLADVSGSGAVVVPTGPLGCVRYQFCRTFGPMFAMTQWEVSVRFKELNFHCHVIASSIYIYIWWYMTYIYIYICIVFDIAWFQTVSCVFIWFHVVFHMWKWYKMIEYL